ncbi:MAG: glucuronate isomerase [Clostridia bacterium]
MENFFSDNVILSGSTSEKLYNEVKDLPIVDYHCHLSPKQIGENKVFTDIGEMWLSCDHYKWRAMRICNVDERLITGEASYFEKFMAYAGIMPKLAGNALYYWTQLELKQIFGIVEPLSAANGENIYKRCNEKLKNISVQNLLNKFKVEYIASTDDPVDTLEYHGQYGNTTLAPTFRPDKVFLLDDEYFKKLSVASGIKINSVDNLLSALENRFDFFIKKGCKISDCGIGQIPDFCNYSKAIKIFDKRNDGLTNIEREQMAGFLLIEIAKMAKKRDIVLQLHFSVIRNSNLSKLNEVGVDAGYDVMANEVSADKLINFFNCLNTQNMLPKTILYTLNPKANELICALSGSFPNVRVGAAWWFNDTLQGTKAHLQSVMEYAVLGEHLGMLTDSRSFASFVRHDFFRRILASEVANLVDRGEYDFNAAKTLMANICYFNIKNFLKI